MIIYSYHHLLNDTKKIVSNDMRPALKNGENVYLAVGLESQK
jgi:hypothetical protein